MTITLALILYAPLPFRYVAVSRLTDDFMGTAGVLTAFEGELEDGQAMIGKGDSSNFNIQSSHKFYIPMNIRVRQCAPEYHNSTEYE